MNENLIKFKVEKTYKDLDVYKLSYELALKIHKLALTLPDLEKYNLVSQLRKAAMSIPANIAEGMTRNAFPNDLIRFLRIAIGSSVEVQVWLNFAKDLQYISLENFEELNLEYDRVGKMLRGLTKYWASKI